MATYEVKKQFPWRGSLSPKAVQVCRMFGLTLDRLAARAPVHACRVEIRAGDIVYVTGPSGAGKSILLRELQRRVPRSEAIHLARVGPPRNRRVIDCFAGDVLTSLRTLGSVGLSDVFSILNLPGRLSDGQKYRFRLALALTAGKPYVFADEFCSALDRITAATEAYNVHRLAKRTGTTLILASSRDDILLDLAPDVLIIKDFDGPAQVIYRNNREWGV